MRPLPLAPLLGFAAGFLTLAPCASAASAPPQEVGERVEWPHWGGDQGSQHYSPLAQVHRGNVSRLRPAWEWDTAEVPLAGPRLPVPDNPVRPASFENTPIVTGGVMYVSTSYNRVAALDPDTGEVLWIYDPRITEWGQVPNGTGFVHRGVALWDGGDGARRVFLNSRWRLISIDAVTGEPDPSFGQGGEIDLTAQLLWPINRLHYTQTSPPVVFEDLVILGNGVWDRFVYERDPAGECAGVPRAHRRVGLVVQPDSPTGRVRQRHLGRPQLGPGGSHQCLGADVPRRGAGAALPAGRHAEQRLLRRTPVGRQPLRRSGRLPRRPHRRAGVALPDRPPRPLGLRPAGGADAPRTSRWTAGRSRRWPRRPRPASSMSSTG